MARQSLAVKYRPKTFEDVTEQASVKIILEEQINTKTFQHSYLLTGPAGTGKTTLARIFANQINKGEGSPIEIDGASNNGVEDVRNIIEGAGKNPIGCDYKIYIIDEVHMLSNGAWNALLKLLEEPPKTAIFVMCTTNPEKIPATIMSRVQRFNLNKISLIEIEKRLEYILAEENKEKGIYHYEEQAIKHIAKISKGGMRDAITMLDKCLSLTKTLDLESVLKVLGGVEHSIYFALTESFNIKDLKTILKIFSDVYDSGTDIKQFIKDFQDFLVDCSKYIIFGDISDTNIPQTQENVANLVIIADDSIFTLLDFIIDLNTTIKWESNVLYIIEALTISYIKNKE